MATIAFSLMAGDYLFAAGMVALVALGLVLFLLSPEKGEA